MTLMKKLNVALGAVGVGSLALSIVGIWGNYSLGNGLKEAVNSTAQKLDLTNAVRARYWEAMAALRGGFVYSSLDEPAKLEEQALRARSALERIQEQLEEIRPLLVTAEGRASLRAAESATAELQRVADVYLECVRQKQWERFKTEVANKLAPVVLRADEALLALRDQQRSFLVAEREEAESKIRRSQILIVALTAALALILVASGFGLRKVNRTLAESVEELASSASQVAAAAGQVSSASQSLAQTATEQASSIQETSASSAEIRALADENTHTAAAAADLVAASVQKARETDGSLHAMQDAMESISAGARKLRRSSNSSMRLPSIRTSSL